MTNVIYPPSVKFVTPDGRVAREWFLFLLNLQRSIDASGTDVNVVLGNQAFLPPAQRIPEQTGSSDLILASQIFGA